jgi:hypothetical protein
MVLEDLQQGQFVAARAEMVCTDIPAYLGNSPGRGNTIRWVFSGKYLNGEMVYFPNAIFDGVGKGIHNPPIKKIMQLGGTAKDSKEEIRLDALMVLINLYFHHHLEDCGGVDPRNGVYRTWGFDEKVSNYENGYFDTLGDLNFRGVNSDSDNTSEYVENNFAISSLPHVQKENECFRRFWQAIEILRQDGYVYEVLQVWDSDPMDNKYAEVLYTLYIFDGHARKKEPSLYKAINVAATYLDLVPPCFGEKSGRVNEDLQGTYIFVEDENRSAVPLSVFRLKYKPNTSDTVRWLEREAAAVEQWKLRIKNANKNLS